MFVPAAVLWDLDGTVVDTEPLWIGAEQELAADHGKVWTEEDGLSLVGSALLVAGEQIRERLELDLTREQIVDHLIDRVVAGMRRSIDWRPGALDLHAAFSATGTPQALVTMSWRPIAEIVTEALAFDVLVTGDAVPRSKPHPDPYLLAAERLGVDPTQCLAIEDSSTGAASAVAAGCRVLAVPHLVPIPPADRLREVPTLVGQTPASLAELFSTVSGSAR